MMQEVLVNQDESVGYHTIPNGAVCVSVPVVRTAVGRWPFRRVIERVDLSAIPEHPARWHDLGKMLLPAWAWEWSP